MSGRIVAALRQFAAKVFKRDDPVGLQLKPRLRGPVKLSDPSQDWHFIGASGAQYRTVEVWDHVNQCIRTQRYPMGPWVRPQD